MAESYSLFQDTSGGEGSQSSVAWSSSRSRDETVSGTRAHTRKSSRGGWTHEEDEELIRIVKQNGGKNWKAVARLFPHHTEQQCMRRWYEVLDPRLVKGNWTCEEDQKLAELVRHLGTRWTEIAKSLPGRMGKQCRERWVNYLAPSIKQTDWTEEEDMILLNEQARVGNHWSVIAGALPGRPDNAIKNRWHVLLRKRLQETPRTGPTVRACEEPLDKENLYEDSGSDTRQPNDNQRHHDTAEPLFAPVASVSLIAFDPFLSEASRGGMSPKEEFEGTEGPLSDKECPEAVSLVDDSKRAPPNSNTPSRFLAPRLQWNTPARTLHAITQRMKSPPSILIRKRTRNSWFADDNVVTNPSPPRTTPSRTSSPPKGRPTPTIPSTSLTRVPVKFSRLEAPPIRRDMTSCTGVKVCSLFEHSPSKPRMSEQFSVINTRMTTFTRPLPPRGAVRPLPSSPSLHEQTSGPYGGYTTPYGTPSRQKLGTVPSPTWISSLSPSQRVREVLLEGIVSEEVQFMRSSEDRALILRAQEVLRGNNDG